MLKIIDVCKSYKEKEVLRGVNFEIKKGEIKGLIGVNGAGKSTLTEIICGVKKYDSGKVLIDGIDISDKKKSKDIKKIIGYMPQSFCLFNDLTVEENLGYISAVYHLEKESVDNIIKLCHLEDYSKVLAKNLSGGYRQLLSLAAAIIHMPKFLILDEPTSAMDPIFRKKFWEIVNACKEKNTTVLVITHHIEELVECDSFVCLSAGKVSFSGTLSEFKNKKMLNIEEILKKYTFED